MASKSSSGKDKAKQQSVISVNKQKTRNLNATLDGLAVKSAAKRMRKEVVKSIIDTDEQLASKPAAKRTRKVLNKKVYSM